MTNLFWSGESVLWGDLSRGRQEVLSPIQTLAPARVYQGAGEKPAALGDETNEGCKWGYRKDRQGGPRMRGGSSPYLRPLWAAFRHRGEEKRLAGGCSLPRTALS